MPTAPYLPGLPPTAATGTAAAPAELRRVAQRFEAQAFAALLQPMFQGLDPKGGPFGGGAAEAQWRPMLVDAIAARAAAAPGPGGNGPLGLADSILRQLLRAQGGGDASAGLPDQPELQDEGYVP